MIPIQDARDAAAEGVGQAPRDPQHYQRAGTLAFAAPPPLSLYVHIPWCMRKCPYCDFNSHEPRADAGDAAQREARYTDALFADLEAALPAVWGRTVHSVFFGGGTPSLFAPEAIDRIVGGIRARLRLESDCEITLEANPGTFERARFAAFRDAGITRLSIGVQSFHDPHLAAIGRVHDRAQALAAVEEAARSFATWNLDLMYALPGQTLADLQADVRTALAFAPPHLSIYHLTVEPNTLFARHPPALPQDDDAYDMLDALTAATAQAGMQRYEVSAYARPGHACWHNRNYWQFGDYLGIGAGASSKLTFAHRVLRQVRVRDPQRYQLAALAGRPIAQEHEVGRADLPFEYMLNALRMPEGFALAQFSERTGLQVTAIAGALQQAEARGLLARDLHRAWPTERGLDFLSDLQAMFLPG